MPNLRPSPLAVLVLPAFLAAGSGHAADEAVSLDTVEVTADSAADAAVAGASDTATVYQVNEDGLATWGGPGGTNPYRAVSGMPSVNSQSADAYGLTNLPGGTKGMRVRGEVSTHGAVGSVDGIPFGTVNPGPGYQWLFDNENIASVALYQGAVAPDQTNVFNTSGALDTRLRWPTGSAGAHISQAFGSDSFSRTFARWDSGVLTGGGAAFISASHTEAEKWRGPGSAPGGRDTAALALVQPIGQAVEVKLMAAYNEMDQDHYRALTYDQAMDLGTYRDYDFSADPSAGINYYGYNRQKFRDWTVLSEITWKISPDSKLVLKPFYLEEKGYYLEGQSSNNKVREWLIDHAWYGLTSEYQTKIGETGLKLGYWGESTEPPGPPTAWKMYNTTASGDLSSFASWAILSKVTERHRYDSVYAMADRQLGKLKVQGGLRYMKETLPAIDAYSTKTGSGTNIGDVSYDEALDQSSGVVANNSVDSRAVHAWLPYLGLGYALTPAVELKASLGRNYGAPSFDVWPVYQANSAKFLAKGITAEDLWQDLKPETSVDLDLGLRVNRGRAWFEPTVYLARFHDKKVSYDPDGTGTLPAYSQNIGETQAWGVQLAGGWLPMSNLSVFGGLSWNRNEFTENLPVEGSSDLEVKGEQIPDVPVWQANMGLTWRQGDFSVTPVARYTGSRWGDTEHTQRIPGYTTVDVSLDYQTKVSFGKLGASLAVVNLFDRKYIGVVRADYYQLLSGGSAIYYPGAPRTLVAKVSLDF
ncbi:TonB-dependent receptor [Parasulfuritortus cantonensis]|uniref:TonB-dependent receptor n=1 Tax=Parasulfuritortus cantonensis TaxID=2528202 RepID=A0A4R1B6P2_9PROT|nr:TonB-dependent receptor [Parasulfuritortus cantonensis]TCJ11655.1 TonB-dependent receptor [Parasulfuritortus cantonensis]